MNLYTAGHSTALLEDFVALIEEHAIDVVVDVRSKPRSRLAHFDQILQSAIEDAGVSYRFLGDRLGGVIIKGDVDYSRGWRDDSVIVSYGIEEIFIPEGSGGQLPFGDDRSVGVAVKVDRFGNAVARHFVVDGEKFELQRE